jgi:hypothetical protein
MFIPPSQSFLLLLYYYYYYCYFIIINPPFTYFNPPFTESLDLAGVSEYIAALKAMGAAAPAGIDDATLATLLEGETPEEVGCAMQGYVMQGYVMQKVAAHRTV